MTVHAYVHSIHNGSVYDVVSKKPIVFYILGIHTVCLLVHACSAHVSISMTSLLFCHGNQPPDSTIQRSM